MHSVNKLLKTNKLFNKPASPNSMPLRLVADYLRGDQIEKVRTDINTLLERYIAHGAIPDIEVTDSSKLCLVVDYLDDDQVQKLREGLRSILSFYITRGIIPDIQVVRQRDDAGDASMGDDDASGTLSFQTLNFVPSTEELIREALERGVEYKGKFNLRRVVQIKTGQGTFTAELLNKALSELPHGDLNDIVMFVLMLAGTWEYYDAIFDMTKPYL